MNIPLAEQLRPKTLDEFFGQEHILGKEKLLRRFIEKDQIYSMIFWGPPGVGKTTLAHLIAELTKSRFVKISAVLSGVGEIRHLIEDAQTYNRLGDKTIVFIDEIHRFNKAQQDVLLPYVENGTFTFIGATTENPSFEVNAPLLSRSRVFHFRELESETMKKITKRALKFLALNLKKSKITIEPKALHHLIQIANGDARNLLNALEVSAAAVNDSNQINLEIAEQAIQAKAVKYDKGADGHFDTISALHKSLRNSDVNASLHYLARMLEAGEDPKYIVRRLIRFASEDIGLADNQALILAVSVKESIHFLGQPEGSLALAQLVIYLALATKSRKVNDAFEKAVNDIRTKEVKPIPLKIRNAPTKLMKDFGFGINYQPYSGEDMLPDNLKGTKYYH